MLYPLSYGGWQGFYYTLIGPEIKLVSLMETKKGTRAGALLRLV